MQHAQNEGYLEMRTGRQPLPGQLKAAIFDFDGTLSTLRHGWEQVMRPLMIEMIGDGRREDDPVLGQLVDDYIDQSTGIQTVYQMRWLAEQVAEWGLAAEVHDEWWYKDEYNRRLMLQVEQRIQALESGAATAMDYLITSSVDVLRLLEKNGIEVCIASGTDHADVVREAGALGLAGSFSFIMGAPTRMAACSKEAVMQKLIEERGYTGAQLLVVGDGKVEIALGAACGAYTLGVASDEARRCGVNPSKHKRLTAAGADAIVGDFSDIPALAAWLALG